MGERGFGEQSLELITQLGVAGACAIQERQPLGRLEPDWEPYLA
jgi:hypothetical protein